MKKVSIGTYSNRKHKLRAQPSRRTNSEKAGRSSITSGERQGRTLVNKKLLVLFVVVLIVGILTFGYLRLQEVNSRVEHFDDEGNRVECSNILNPSCWTEAFKPQLKQTDGYTNGLVIGLDTRKGQSSLKNTDTIIFFSFNHETQKTMLVSIPRDFFVPVYRTKINAIYAFTADRNPEDEFFYIKEMVSNIVGKPIHYFATVRFEGVIEGIDELGGVKICTEDSFTAMYPNDKATSTSPDQWFYYDFKKGCQQLDGEKALVYARFRYLRSGPSSLASDFSRARRQQEIIEALKDKLLKEEKSVAERAEEAWALMQTFNESVKVYDVAFEDVLAGLSFINSADLDPLNVVLDPAFGGYNNLIYASSDSSTGYIIQARDSSYKAIQDYVDLIWEFPDFYREEPRIHVRNMTGNPTLWDKHPAVRLKNETAFYNQITYSNEEKTDKFYGVKLFDFTAGKKPGSLEFVRTFLKVSEVEELPEEYGIERSSYKEDFLIVVGPKAEPVPTEKEQQET